MSLPASSFPYIDPGLGAFYVIAFAALEIGLLGLVRRRLRLAPLLRMWPTFLAIGLCVAVSTNLNYFAMAYIDPGVAAMVGKMTVLFSLGFGLFWLGDRFSLGQGVGSAIAVVGLAVISFQPGDYLGLGTLMILLSTFIYALHAALTKRNMGDVDLLNFFFYRLLLTAAFLALFNLARGEMALPSREAFPILLLVATVDVVISRLLYYRTLRKLDMSVFAVALAASPVAAVIWSRFPLRRVPHRSAAPRRSLHTFRRRAGHRRPSLGTQTAPRRNPRRRISSQMSVLIWAVGRKRPPLCRGCAPATPPLQKHASPTVFTLPQHRVWRTVSTPPLLSHPPNPCSSPAVPLQFRAPCGPPKFGGRVKRNEVRIPPAPHSSEVVYQTRWITEPSCLIVKA